MIEILEEFNILSEILIKILDEFRGHQTFWSECRLVVIVGPSKLEFWLRFLKNSTWIPWSSARQLLKHSDDISSSDKSTIKNSTAIRFFITILIASQGFLNEIMIHIPSQFLVHLIRILEEFWRHLVSWQLSRISHSSDFLIRIVVACFEEWISTIYICKSRKLQNSWSYMGSGCRSGRPEPFILESYEKIRHLPEQ